MPSQLYTTITVKPKAHAQIRVQKFNNKTFIQWYDIWIISRDYHVKYDWKVKTNFYKVEIQRIILKLVTRADKLENPVWYGKFLTLVPFNKFTISVWYLLVINTAN